MATMTTISGDKFIPEIWADETRKALEAELRVTDTIKKFNHAKERGDTIHVPDISDLTANDMSQTGEVTTQTITESELTITIDKWKEASFKIADILKAQSQYDLRSEYTSKAGYAIAKQTEIDVIEMMLGATGTALDNEFDADGTALTNGGTAITRDGILTALQKLDEANVPETDRFILIPPSQKKVILGIDNFISSDYISGRPIMSGQVGEMFGARVLVSSLLSSESTLKKTNGMTGTKQQVLIYQRECGSIAMQKDLRAQAEYMLKNLAWLYTTDTIYGVKLFRSSNGVILRTNQA